MNILIVRLGSLGDIVHALPVVAALRSRFADARIDWLVETRYAAVLEFATGIDHRIVVGRGLWGSSAGAPGALSILGELRRTGYDVAFDLQGLIKSAAFARLSGARRVVGFDRAHLRERAASMFYTEMSDTGRAVHVVDKNLSVLAAIGIEGAARTFPMRVPASAAADDAQAAAVGDNGGRYALVNPGAAWPNKRWPVERFGAVASHIFERHGLRSVVLWGPGEESLAAGIVLSSGGAAVAAPPTNVGDILALAERAAIVLSGDTGPLHLAGAVGAPIVALFGPTDPARNGPWDPDDISLSQYEACVCHYQRKCRRDRPCIEDLSVEDVRGAIDRRLASVRHHG